MLDPQVVISILNWKGYPKTLACVESLLRLDYHNYKIIIVDNDSQDNSVQQLQKRFPEIEIIQSSENLGYAGGNQLALEQAIQEKADLFWILNNDTTVSADTLSQLIAIYYEQSDALYGSVPVRTDPETGELMIDFPVSRFKLGYKAKLFVSRDPTIYAEVFDDLKPREVSALSGSSLLIPISVVKKYGFMDTSFFLYAEETDYCYRLHQQGIPSILVPKSVVYHQKGGSSKGRKPLEAIIRYYQARNLLIWTRKWQPRTEYWMVLGKLFMRTLSWYIRTIAEGKAAFRNGYFTLMGIKDAIFNRTGKTFAPEDYVELS